MSSKEKKVIGFFDSGLGGLSVLNQLVSLFSAKSFSFCYIADRAYMPYGELSIDKIRERTQKAFSFLSSKGCDLIVNGCHTSCVYTENLFPSSFGIAESSVEEIISHSEFQKWLILGTFNTIISQFYEKIFQKKDLPLQIFSHACPSFASFVERGVLGTPNEKFLRKSMVEKELFPVMSYPIDALLLGCSHYPFLIEEIRACFPHVEILDPAKSLAFKVGKFLSLKEKESFSEGKILGKEDFSYEGIFYVTEGAKDFEKRKNVLFPFSQARVQQIDPDFHS